MNVRTATPLLRRELPGIILIVGWFVLAACFVFWTPLYPKHGYVLPIDQFYHAEYVRYLATHHSLPPVRTLFMAYHPPLWYLLQVPIITHHLNDSLLVRLGNAGWGALSITCAYCIARRTTALQPTAIALGLATFATIPGFIIASTGYTNDSMANFFTLASICFSLLLLRSHVRLTTHICLLVLSVALGMYTKYSSIYLIPAVALVCTTHLIAGKTSARQVMVVGLAIVGGISLFLPYAIMHNRAQTGKLLPTNFETKRPDSLPSTLPFIQLLNPLHLVDASQWSTPFHYNGPYYWSKHTLYGTFVSSGYFASFSSTPALSLGQMTGLWIGFNLFITLLAILILMWRKLSVWGVLALGSFLAHVLHIAYAPIYDATNSRYFAWIFLILGLCLATTVQKSSDSRSIAAFAVCCSVANCTVLGLLSYFVR